MTTWQPTHPRRLQPQLSDPMNTDRTGNLHTHADCNLPQTFYYMDVSQNWQPTHPRRLQQYSAKPYTMVLLWQPTHPRRLQRRSPFCSDPVTPAGNLHTHADCNHALAKEMERWELATYTPTQIATFHRRRNQMSYPLATYTPTQIATTTLICGMIPKTSGNLHTHADCNCGNGCKSELQVAGNLHTHADCNRKIL